MNFPLEEFDPSSLGFDASPLSKPDRLIQWHIDKGRFPGAQFAANSKEGITVQQVITHQGGFPNSNISRAAWVDDVLMRDRVCAFKSEWPAGSRRGTSASPTCKRERR